MPYVLLDSGITVWRRNVPLARGTKPLRQWPEPPPEERERATLVWKFDIVFSRWIRRRDERCVLCGKVAGLQASHFWKRAWLHTRWHPRNVFAMCPFHNKLHNTNRWPYTNFLLERFGDAVLGELLEIRNRKAKIENYEIEAWLAEYETLLRAA